GWEAKGEPGAWTLQDGVLSCKAGPNTWFGSKADYTDFVIDFEFKLPKGGNSGVFIRVPKVGHPTFDGMEVQILDDSDPQYKDVKDFQKCGSIWGIQGPDEKKKKLKPAGQWNHMRVMVDSDYVMVELNGETILDTDGQQQPEIYKRSASGPVGLQSEETGVSFRNIKFADLAADRAERMKWWHDAKFGMFVHWGAYAVRGEGEWVMNYGRMSTADYEKMAAQFDPKGYDPAEWVKLVKEAGGKYIVVTSKHHDGFCIWNSKTTDYDMSHRTPYKKDPLKMLADECAKQGIRLGFYYSIADWHHPDYLPISDWDPAVRPADQRDMTKYLDYMEAQLKELCTNYGPVACIWYDGAHQQKEPWKKARFAKINRELRRLQPGIIINDRSNHLEDYVTPEQFVPPIGVRHYDGSFPAWESCMTITTGNGSFPHMAWWGYDKNETKFKEPARCIRMLPDIVSRGGNLLLNIGPDANGKIVPAEAKVFAAIGEWLKVNGEAIYGADKSPFKQLPFKGVATVKGKMLYVHLYEWPSDHMLTFPGLKNEIVSAKLLAGGGSLKTSRDGDGDWVVELPQAAPDPVVSVLALELKGPPVVEPGVVRLDKQGRITLQAIDANLTGGPGLHFRYESCDDIVHIGRWVNTEDVATWQFQVPESGEYEMSAEYAAEAGGRPSGEMQISLSAGDSSSSSGEKWVKFVRPVHATGAPDKFETQVIGRCTLTKGLTARLSVVALQVPKNIYMMNLRHITFTPVGTTAAESEATGVK
ncbi:MAG: alpha-L-fucosidase, partial [Phycisphaerae bacterium]|nr:alpha-L-fucosidase [Phycisphaerae bacterium]